MTRLKRTGALNSSVRERILRSALKLIDEEGFNSVTAPRLAAEIGLRRPIIYYYFDDIDHLLVAAIRLAYAETRIAAMDALSSDKSIETLWQIFSIAAAPLSELMARALRSEPFRDLYQEVTRDMRTIFAKAIEHERAAQHVDDPLDAASLAFFVQTLSAAVAMERRMGITIGHSDIRRIFHLVVENSGFPPASNIVPDHF